MAEADEILESLMWLHPDDLVVIQRAARFWKKIERQPGALGCWLWTDNLLVDGYGQFEHYRAHRVAYELAVGPIPPGMSICHRCDVRRCVRPDHLFAGTHTDNMRDTVAKDRPLGQRKLSNAQVAWIREAVDRGSTQRSLARVYGVHPQTIFRVVHEETHRKGVMS